MAYSGEKMETGYVTICGVYNTVIQRLRQLERDKERENSH